VFFFVETLSILYPNLLSLAVMSRYSDTACLQRNRFLNRIHGRNVIEWVHSGVQMVDLNRLGIWDVNALAQWNAFATSF